MLGMHAGCLQEYIHNENQRLEEEQQFWSKEIVVRIEYKFCPNLTIIDTPGGHAGQAAAIICPHQQLPSTGCLEKLPVGELMIATSLTSRTAPGHF
jgi:hypothetical protein